MATIKKIKLPNETTPRDLGVLSSNVSYNGSTIPVTLNEKISSLEQIIGNLHSIDISVVDSLPDNPDDHTLYFVPQEIGSTVHDEYMYVNNAWELIGSTEVDLSGYLMKSAISATSAFDTGVYIGSITIDGTSTTFYAPNGVTATSELTNDSGFIDASALTPYVQSSSLATVATSGSYADLSNTPTIPDAVSYSSTLGSGEEVGKITIGSTTTTLYAPTPTVVEVSPILHSGVSIGNITVDGVTTTWYVPEDSVGSIVSVTTSVTTGVPIAEFVVNGETTILYSPASGSDVNVIQSITTGVEIGKIDVDGTTTSLYAPAQTSPIYKVNVESDGAGGYEFTDSSETYSNISGKISDGYVVQVVLDGEIYDYMGNDWWKCVYNDGTKYVQITSSSISYTYETDDTITATQALTTGVPVGTITVGSTTTTLYAPEVVVSQRYLSGNEIGSVNGTTLYAPTISYTQSLTTNVVDIGTLHVGAVNSIIKAPAAVTYSISMTGNTIYLNASDGNGSSITFNDADVTEY